VKLEDLAVSVTYGSLLGDASISRDRTTYCLAMRHSVAQLSYLEWKAKAIGLTGKIRPAKSGYGSDVFEFHHYDLGRLEKVYKVCVFDAKKRVTSEWLSMMDDVSLAVWYQDDGSWGRAGNRLKNGERSQLQSSFHTCGFDRDSVSALQEWLSVKFGIQSKFALRKGRYPTVVMHHTSTIKLWTIVAPYLVIRSKVDAGPRIDGRFWINPELVGTETELPNPPEKEKVFRYNMASTALKYIEHDGSRLHLNEWSRLTGLKRETISGRMKRGWTVSQSLGFDPRYRCRTERLSASVLG